MHVRMRTKNRKAHADAHGTGADVTGAAHCDLRDARRASRRRTARSHSSGFSAAGALPCCILLLWISRSLT